MKGLSFFSRIALICNLFFLACLVIQRTGQLADEKETGTLTGIVIILGWFVAPFLNLVVNLCYSIVLMRKQQLMVPAWLAFANFLFLLLQLFIHFILP